MIKQSFFLILLLGFIIIPAYAYNSGFQPVYQPPAPPGGISNIHNIGNVTSIGCALGQVLAVNGSAIWACLTLSGTGEINTASSSGVGYSLVLPKVLFDLPFKGLWVSGDLTISQNATDITIGHTPTTSTDTNTAQIVSAGGLTLFKQRDNATQNTIKGLTAGQGISMTQNTNDIEIQTDFLIDTLSLLANDFFISSFNNSTGDWTTKQFSVNTITCSGTDKVSAINNVTGQVTCSTDAGGSGIASINSAPATTAKILQSNSTTKATFKTLTQSTGITLTNGSSAVTIATDHKVNTKALTTGYVFVSYNNATTNGNFGTATIKNKLLDGSNHTDTTAQDPTRGSIIYVDSTAKWNELAIGSNGQVLTSGASDISWVTPSSGSGITTLVSNVTRTAPPASAHALVWTIALTANSGNAIEGVLIASSNTAGVAVQAGANVTNLGSRGYCHWSTPTTSALTVLDNLVMNTVLTGSVTDTGETTWLPAVNVALPISFNCAINTGATPGNLKIYFQPETTGTASIKAGSFYIKTP